MKNLHGGVLLHCFGVIKDWRCTVL